MARRLYAVLAAVELWCLRQMMVDRAGFDSWLVDHVKSAKEGAGLE
jgi:hypothetical protein